MAARLNIAMIISADMLSATRYAPCFRVDGDKSVHYGLFDCAPAAAEPTSTGQARC